MAETSADGALIEAKSVTNGNRTNAVVTVTFDDTFVLKLRCAYTPEPMVVRYRWTMTAEAILKTKQLGLTVDYDRVTVSEKHNTVTCSAEGQADFSVKMNPRLLAALRDNNFRIAE